MPNGNAGTPRPRRKTGASTFRHLMNGHQAFQASALGMSDQELENDRRQSQVVTD
jgi:hypothetical protein